MRFGWLAAAAAVVCSGQAQAAEYISYSSFGSYGGGVGVQFGAVSQFDERLGTLESVRVTVDLLAQLAGTAFALDSNYDPAFARFTPTTTRPASFELNSIVVSVPVDPAVPFYDVTGIKSFVIDYNGRNSSGTTRDLGSFIGNGAIRPSYNNFVWPGLAVRVSARPGVNAFFGPDDSGGSLRFTVTYGYVVPGGVPEPASWAMMILGMGAVGVSLRRSRGTAPKVRFI